MRNNSISLRKEKIFEKEIKVNQIPIVHPGVVPIPTFDKNEGKIIFKITKYDKITKKEKIQNSSNYQDSASGISKPRRIITKCQHTSLKYYAKGMCK